MGMHGKTNTSNSNLLYGVSSYTIIMCTCSFNVHFATTKTHARLMNSQWPVVRLAVRMSSVTGHFMDATLNGTVHFVCSFVHSIMNFFHSS